MGGGEGGQSLGLLAVLQYFKIIEAEFYNYFYKVAKTYLQVLYRVLTSREIFFDTFE